MQRKTLTERLTNKYQLIVRNEENFADRWTFSFNFARLLVILTVLVLLFYALVTGINFLGAYLLGSGKSEESQQLVALASRVDSLEYEMEMKDEFILGFKSMLDGGEPKRKDTTDQKAEKIADSKISKEEEEFRKKFEKEVSDPSYKSVDGFNLLYFSAPITGKVTNFFQNDVIIGLFIEADKSKPVKALDEGVVILNIQNPDSTYRLILQHKTGLLTIYDRLKQPLVKTGVNVQRGMSIAAPAKQKVTFSMVYNGKLLNPRQYISWNK